MNKKIDQAILTLQKGGVIIYPTDTAFGIGCRVDDERAVDRVVAIKGRPKNKAMPILASDMEMAGQYVDTRDLQVGKLMRDFWPGGLTIVLPTHNPSLATGIKGGDTVGIRIPNHRVLRDVIRGVGVPIIGSSANLSGGPTPFAVSELDPVLASQVDLVLEGECGGNRPSTVVDCTGMPWQILRQGAADVDVSAYV